MTSPNDSVFFTPELAAQYTKVLGAHPVFTTRPNIAAALAQANPSREEAQIVGGFLESLDITRNARLARAGGAKMFFSDKDKAYLQMLGEDYADVDAAPAVAAADKKVADASRAATALSEPGQQAAGLAPPKGFFGGAAHLLGQAGHVVANVTNAPGVKQVIGGLNTAADATRGLVRVGTMTGTLGFGVGSPEDLGEAVKGITEQGYDPSNPVSVIQFFAKGENNFHSLNDLRDKYGAGTVQAAQDYLISPETFQISGDFDDTTNAVRIQALNDPRWKEVLTQVDARHMSGGRDVARDLGLQPGSKPFSAVSGSLDAVESWYVDPTIIGGKLGKAQKLGKLSIDSLTDEQGIRRMLSPTTGNKRVIVGWQNMLDRSRAIRAGTTTGATAEEKAAAAGAYAAIRSESPALAPLVDEINGKVPFIKNVTQPLARGAEGPERLLKSETGFTHAEPIETMDDLTEYLVNKNALVRTLRGAAPKVGVYMPGSVSHFAARKASVLESVAARAALKHENRVIDLSKDAGKVIATPDSAVGGLLGETDKAGKLRPLNEAGEPMLTGGEATATVEAAANRGDALRAMQGGSPLNRGRFLKAARRYSALVPTDSFVDFYAPKTTDTVYRWAQIMMPRSEARMIAAKFSASDLAGRRTVYKAMQESAIHASGMESSATGRDLARKMRGDMTAEELQKYSLAPDADRLADDAGMRNVAVFPGQLSREMWLAPFPDLQRVAAKASLYDYTLKRVAEAPITDKIMSGVRLAWQITSAGALRNIMEGWAGAAASGVGWDAFRAKLSLSQARTMRQVEREVGYGPLTTARAYHAARARRMLRHVRAAKASALGHLSSNDLDQAASILGTEVAEGHLSELGMTTASNITGVADPRNLEQVAEIAKMGARPANISFGRWEQKGWGEVAANGEAGARNWAHNLDQVVGDTPVLGKRLVEAVRGQQGTATSVGENFADARMHALALHIAEHPEMAEFRELAELAATMQRAATPELKLEAAHDIADRMARSFKALTHGEDGQPIHQLLDRLENGQVPSLDWFAKHVPTASRPDHVIGREWAPVAANPDKGGIAGIGQTVGRGLTESMSKAYGVVVSGPISRLSTQPIYVANFARARKALGGYEAKLVEGGLSPEAAELHATKLALDHAMDMTSRMIDNPEVASQMATISRNMINFPRAAEDWVRRWYHIVKEDPTTIRKVQLALEGGQHTGIIDRDSNGNLVLVYKGSGAAVSAVLRAGEFLHIPHVASIPTVPDMSTKVLYLNPSLNNPFFPGASPLIVTPLKVAAAFLPGQKLMLEDLQSAATGDERASGQGIFQQFLPSVVKNLFTALSPDEQSAQFASAQMNALLHMEAAGLTPDAIAAKEGRAPSAQDREIYLARVRTAAKNQLFLRALFAFALPGTPSLPENEAPGGANNADAIYQAQGIRNLDDEARVLINQLGMERALAVWTKVHPDKLMYFVGRSKTDSPYSSVAPTRAAEVWMEDHRDFVTKYPTIAAYLVPDTPGKFSPEAYRAQLEEHIRSRKGVDEFYSDMRIITAEQTYYSVRDQRDKLVAEATAKGDTEGVKQAKATWTAWTQGDASTGEPGFLNLNPLFAQKLASYGERTVWREQAVGDLDRMVNSGAFEAGSKDALPADAATVDGIKKFVAACRYHNQFTDSMRGKRDTASLQAKDAEQINYNKHMLGITGATYDSAGRLAGGNPALRDLYQGLFRGLD